MSSPDIGFWLGPEFDCPLLLGGSQHVPGERQLFGGVQLVVVPVVTEVRVQRHLQLCVLVEGGQQTQGCRDVLANTARRTTALLLTPCTRNEKCYFICHMVIWLLLHFWHTVLDFVKSYIIIIIINQSKRQKKINDKFLAEKCKYCNLFIDLFVDSMLIWLLKYK